MTVDISLDKETWGTRAGFDIRSIGACVFNLESLEINPAETFYIACENPVMVSYSKDYYSPRQLDKLHGNHRRYQLNRDPRTVDWWYDTAPAEAQAAFANPIDLKEALQLFSNWLAEQGVDPKNDKSARIWAHGAAFDPPILEAVYYAVGLPIPWHYRAPRDTRTAFDFAGINDHSGWMKQHQQGVFHHARDDAMSQANAISGAFKRRYSFSNI